MSINARLGRLEGQYTSPAGTAHAAAVTAWYLRFLASLSDAERELVGDLEERHAVGEVIDIVTLAGMATTYQERTDDWCP